MPHRDRVGNAPEGAGGQPVLDVVGQLCAPAGQLREAVLVAPGREGSAHLLVDDEVLTRVRLPAPEAGERAAYFRAISRFEAEWPLVEAVVRVARDDAGTLTSCGLAIGGVAPVPLRLSAVEGLLIGSRLDDDTISAAAAAATQGASPLPETGYKVQLVEATVREVLERVRS